MKVVKITANDTFSHGRLNMRAGDIDKLEEGEARELEKAGLITIGKGEPEDADDLLGETKMAPVTSNKMEKPAANKHTK